MPENKRILVIGCGKTPIKGAVNLDILPLPEADIVCDITKGIPVADNEFGVVVASYVLCQIADRDKFKFVMNEIHRVLCPGGVLKMKVPDARFPAAFQDPMDCRYFVRETFDYFNKDHYRYKVFQYGFKPWEIYELRQEREDRLYAELKKPL